MVRLKANLDCIPCLQKQALRTVRFTSEGEDVQEQVLRQVMDALSGMEWRSTPPGMAHKVYRIVRRATGKRDPYKEVKRESNDLVLEMYPELEGIVEGSADPVRTAIRLAVAGNIIDYGAVQQFDLRETMGEVLNQEFAIDHYQRFERSLEEADTLLFFTDNAGEIVFDRLLVECMLKVKELEKVRWVVKGGPIINDATLEDAIHAGLHQVPNGDFWTLSNGGEPGPKRNSSQVEKWIEEHDLVISKGQGNYEGLSEHRGLFFLLMVKCPIIASHLGVEVKDIVLKYAG